MLTAGCNFFPRVYSSTNWKVQSYMLKPLYKAALQELFKNEQMTRTYLNTKRNKKGSIKTPTTSQTVIRSQHHWYRSPLWNTGSPSVELIRWLQHDFSPVPARMQMQFLFSCLYLSSVSLSSSIQCSSFVQYSGSRANLATKVLLWTMVCLIMECKLASHWQQEVYRSISVLLPLSYVSLFLQEWWLGLSLFKPW